MKLSIIVPVFNEEKTIAQVIDSLLELEIEGGKEIIVVNDGSTDKTLEEISKKRNAIVVLSYQENFGKGFAIRKGFRSAQGEFVVIHDADLEYKPKFIPILLKKAIELDCGAVYGMRSFLGENRGKKLLVHDMGNLFLSALTSILFFYSIFDMETGQKLFKTSVLKNLNLKANRFDFEPEVTAKLLRGGFKIFEVPIVFTARGFHDGKKITIFDGIKAVFVLIQERFSNTLILKLFIVLSAFGFSFLVFGLLISLLAILFGVDMFGL